MIGQFKKDNYVVGSMIGLLLPLLSALIIYVVLHFLGYADFVEYFKVYLLSIVINIFLIRYYMINLNFEKTARAILFVTFIYLIAFFVYYFKR